MGFDRVIGQGLVQMTALAFRLWMALCSFGLMFGPAFASDPAALRVAIWNVEADRDGPGLLLRDIIGGKDPQIISIISVLNELSADVLLLTGFDYDYDLLAARHLSDRLQRPYEEIFAFQPNSGWRQGYDLNGDGRANDAQGWGKFAGQGAMVLFSHFRIDRQRAEDFSRFPWQSLPNSLGKEVASEAQYLATTGHWRVPVDLGGLWVDLLAFHATPPVFDGPEDRNGRRNHDEAAFWAHYLASVLPYRPPEGPIILLGTSNLDPEDGEGRAGAIKALLSHDRLQELKPRSKRGHYDPNHQGDPALDTALFPNIGGLRVEILLADRALNVANTAVFWPEADHRLWRDLATASRHGPVYADILPHWQRGAQ